MRFLRWNVILVPLLLAVTVGLADEPAGPAAAVDFSGTWLAADGTPYGTPPARYEGARMYRLTFKTAPEVLRALVPPPLEPDGSGQMSVVFADLTVVGKVGGSYNEAYLSVPVKLGETIGSYMPILYLDEALPIIAGREVFGHNKVGAEINITEKDGAFHGTVVREGKTLIEMTAQFGDPMAPPPVPIGKSFNLKLIPPVEEGAGPAVKQLTAYVLQDFALAELRPGMGKVTFASLPTEPLAEIPVGEVVFTAATVSDFAIPYGEVVHDYLADDSEVPHSPGGLKRQ